MGRPEGPVARRADYELRRHKHSPSAPWVEGAQMIAAYHYAGGAANTAVAMYGLYRKGTGELVAVAQYLPPTKPAATYVAQRCPGTDWRQVLSLSRLVVAPGEPKNVASLLIGGSVRDLRKDRRWKALLTYADRAEGHIGTIYKATNWIQCGEAGPRARWVDSAGRHVARKATVDRTHAEMERLGLRRLASSRKLRFILPLSGTCTCPT